MTIRYLKKYVKFQASKGFYMMIDNVLMGLQCYGKYEAYDKVLRCKNLIIK